MIVVSNRALTESEKPAGGLGVALRNTLEAAGGHWFCVVPHKDAARADFTCTEEKWQSADVAVHTIHVPADMYEQYYGYANKLAWTVNHDRPDLARFTLKEQKAYGTVLDRVADIITEVMSERGITKEPVWIHDFHLAGLGQRMKDLFQRMGISSRILFHLHTPVASTMMKPITPREEFESTGTIFKKGDLSTAFKNSAIGARTLNWLEKTNRRAHEAYLNFMRDMTYFDSVTFQTENVCQNFLKSLKIKPVTGTDFPRFVARTIGFEDRSFTMMNAPISIPSRKILQNLFASQGRSASENILHKWERVEKSLSEEARDLVSRINDSTEYVIYTGAERGDFSKGIVERARGYYRYLNENPEMHGRVQMLQIMVSTRGNIDKGDNEYTRVTNETQYWFDKAAKDFGTDEWSPVILRDKAIANSDAILLGRAVRFAGGKLRHTINLTGAIRDGLNLACEEGAIAQDDDYPGLTVVPKNIGAAQELGPLTLTYDPEDERAFDGVMEKAIDIYARKDCLPVLRRMHKDMKNFLVQNDLGNWAVQCLRTVSGTFADKVARLMNAEGSASAGEPRQQAPTNG